MGQALSAWEARTRVILGSPSATDLPTADLEDHVRAAVRKFSADQPRTLFSDYAGDGSTYDLAIPAAWVQRFSSVQAVEYPTGNRPETFLDLEEVTLYPRDSAPTHIRLNRTTPGSGKTARIYWSRPWPIPDATAATDLIPDEDFDPVCHYAAYLGALQLAAKAAGHKKPTLPGADAVDWDSEADRWRRLAKEKRRVYDEHVGTDSGPPPASAVTDWDARATWPATRGNFLFRGRR